MTFLTFIIDSRFRGNNESLLNIEKLTSLMFKRESRTNKELLFKVENRINFWICKHSFHKIPALKLPKNFLLIFASYLLTLFHSPLSYADLNLNIDPTVYVKSYPEHIRAVQDNYLIWQDGTKMPIKIYQEPRPFEEALKEPDLYSQISITYPKGSLEYPPSPNSDPGRIRYVPFFQKMYGATKEEVQKNLVEIDWMPRTFKDKEHYAGNNTSTVKLWVTKVNDVDKILQKISHELDELVAKKPEYKKYLENPGGTFSWRFIAGTNRPSAHSFGMSIDINAKYSSYWLWNYKKILNLPLEANVDESTIPIKVVPPYHNDVPWEIVAIFEKYHYIWGGKWFHFDTMHFEYRPELFLRD